MYKYYIIILYSYYKKSVINIYSGQLFFLRQSHGCAIFFSCFNNGAMQDVQSLGFIFSVAKPFPELCPGPVLIGLNNGVCLGTSPTNLGFF